MIPTYTVDSFTDKPFCGNPAAVCLLSQKISDATMQKIAAELKLSETSFVECEDESDSFEIGSSFSIRWFTPTHEVDLCGHATLASAKILFDVVKNPSNVITFRSRSGLLGCRRNGDQISMDFPQYKVEPAPKNEVIESIVKEATSSPSFGNGLPVSEVMIARKQLLIVLDSSVAPQVLEEHVVNTSRLLDLDRDAEHVTGLMLSVKGAEDDKYDFYSRYFAPWLGIPEDPVTGFAYSVLGPYWHNVLNKTEMKARQCSRRGGDLFLKMLDNSRIQISGCSVIIFKGVLTI